MQTTVGLLHPFSVGFQIKCDLHRTIYLKELKAKVFLGYNIFTVGECPNVTVDKAAIYTHELTGVVNMLFHFEIMNLDMQPGLNKWSYRPWSMDELRATISKWQTGLTPGWVSMSRDGSDLV